MNGCERWTIKKAEHWRFDAFELWCWRRLLRVPWNARRSNQSILKKIILKKTILKKIFGRTNAKAETPILQPPHAKSWLIGKDSDAGRDWGQEEKGMTEDEMAGWHHGLDGRESEWTLGDGDGQGDLARCDSWGRKESDTTERLHSLTHSAFFTVQLSHPYMTTGKTIALTIWTLVGKVMSLLLNILSRLVTTFLPKSKHLLISWLQSPSAVILEPPKIKSDTVSIASPYISHEVEGTRGHDLRFLNVEL